MYLTNASISALFRRIELFAALSGLFFAHNSLKINCFHHWDGLYVVSISRLARFSYKLPPIGLRRNLPPDALLLAESESGLFPRLTDGSIRSVAK